MGTLRSRAARLTLVATVALGALGASAGSAAAATSIGQYRPAVVQCNYRNHILTLTASASPAPGFATQTVWYQYFVYDLTAGQYVGGLNPTQFGTINAYSQTTNAYGMTVINLGTTDSAQGSWYVPAGHHFAVRTDYWWYIGGAWYGRTGVWSAAFEEYGYAWDAGNGNVRTDFCVA
jgi:hypothetical protein